MQNKIFQIEVIASHHGEIRPDYSGRGMFGKTCYGIVCDDANKCLEAAGSYGITGGKVDNMGRQFIVYWPEIN